MNEEDKAKIEKIEAILKNFMHEVENIRHHRDEKIQAIIKRVEQGKIQDVLDDINNLKE